MSIQPKIVIIGLDGVPFEMIRSFTQTGLMPATAELLSHSYFGRMNSSIPDISNVAWSSVITGAGPAVHGIFGFMDMQPGSYRLTFPNFSDLKAAPFWDKWPGKSVIINVPGTYPVRPMNGVHISGFVSIDLNRSVYPTSLIAKLRSIDYRLDVDSQKAHSSISDFLVDLDKTLTARIEAYRYLWHNIDWQTFMLVFTGTDRLMHFLWNAYADPNHKYHGQFREHFAKIDRAVGEIISQLSDDDIVVMHSDHGFEALDYEVYINYILMQNGLMAFSPGGEPSFDKICQGTKAFALDPARIYLNRKDKYPCGSVEPAHAEKILDDLESLFADLKIDGKKVIRKIHRKHDIYTGPYQTNAPDMVLMPESGFNLKASLRTTKPADKGIFTGKHTYDTAFLLMRGIEESAIPATPSVTDIIPLIENQSTP